MKKILLIHLNSYHAATYCTHLYFLYFRVIIIINIIIITNNTIILTTNIIINAKMRTTIVNLTKCRLLVVLLAICLTSQPPPTNSPSLSSASASSLSLSLSASASVAPFYFFTIFIFGLLICIWHRHHRWKYFRSCEPSKIRNKNRPPCQNHQNRQYQTKVMKKRLRHRDCWCRLVVNSSQLLPVPVATCSRGAAATYCIV